MTLYGSVGPLGGGGVCEGKGADPVCMARQAAHVLEQPSRASQQQPNAAVHPSKSQQQPA